MTFIVKTFLSRNLFTENCTLKALRLGSFTVLFHFKVTFFKVIQSHFLQSSNRNNSPSLTRKLNRKWPKPKWIPYLLWRSNTRMPDSNFEKDSCRNSLVPWANFQLKRYECFFLKKLFCFVCLLCLHSSFLSITEIQNNAHVLRIKMEVSFASFARWHTTDPCLTKTFALFLRFIASCMFYALCMCCMFASMSNGCIVYHAFHGLHILLRFKLILFLRSLCRAVPWNTMYNKAILVFFVVR